MYQRFIGVYDSTLIQNDFTMLLQSEEAVQIEFVTIRKSLTKLDRAFGNSDALSVSEVRTTERAIQEIVKSIHEEILKWGILQAGDCIFYCRNEIEVDLSGDEIYIETPDGVKWTPVPYQMVDFYKYITTRLGAGQVGQAIPCRIKRSA